MKKYRVWLRIDDVAYTDVEADSLKDALLSIQDKLDMSEEIDIKYWNDVDISVDFNSSIDDNHKANRIGRGWEEDD